MKKLRLVGADEASAGLILAPATGSADTRYVLAVDPALIKAVADLAAASFEAAPEQAAPELATPRRAAPPSPAGTSRTPARAAAGPSSKGAAQPLDEEEDAQAGTDGAAPRKRRRGSRGGRRHKKPSAAAASPEGHPDLLDSDAAPGDDDDSRSPGAPKAPSGDKPQSREQSKPRAPRPAAPKPRPVPAKAPGGAGSPPASGGPEGSETAATADKREAASEAPVSYLSAVPRNANDAVAAVRSWRASSDNGVSELATGEAVAENLKAKRVRVPDAILDESWEAKPRQGGGWIVTFSYLARGQARSAEWVVDDVRREVRAANTTAGDLGFFSAEVAARKPPPRKAHVGRRRRA